MGEKQPIPQKQPFAPFILIEGGYGRVTITDLMRASRQDDIYTMFDEHSKNHPDIPIHVVLDHPNTRLVFDKPWVSQDGQKPATKANLRNGGLNSILDIRVENDYARSDEEAVTLRPPEGTEIVVWARHETTPPSVVTFHRIITPNVTSK